MPTIPPEPYRRRLVDPHLDRLLAELPAVMLVGPRAAGKTTTAVRRAATTVRLNVPAEAAAFEADPDAALRGLLEPVLLDEWQAVPTVLGAARRAVDDDPRPSRFIVTGSVRAQIENAVWPATGRFVRVPLYPMTIREQRGRVDENTFFDKLVEGTGLAPSLDTPDLRGYVELALTSGFPQPSLLVADPQLRRAWLESYIRDLLTHDVEQAKPSTTRPRDARRLRRYFEAYSLSSAGVCDHKTIYEAAHVTRDTAIAYDELLTALFVVEEVPAWATNRLKRLIHYPKRYVVDAALLAAILHLDDQGVLRDGDVLGRVLDTFVAAQLRPEAALSRGSPRLYHVRTPGGRHEIDLVAEFGGERVVALEIKATAAPRAVDAKHLAWLRDELGDRFLRGIVFHTGPRVFELGDRLTAAPISVLWG